MRFIPSYRVLIACVVDGCGCKISTEHWRDSTRQQNTEQSGKIQCHCQNVQDGTKVTCNGVSVVELKFPVPFVGMDGTE